MLVYDHVKISNWLIYIFRWKGFHQRMPWYRNKLTFNLSYLDEKNGIIINGVGQQLNLGSKISRIGDINNDGC